MVKGVAMLVVLVVLMMVTVVVVVVVVLMMMVLVLVLVLVLVVLMVLMLVVMVVVLKKTMAYESLTALHIVDCCEFQRPSMVRMALDDCQISVSRAVG